MTEAIQQAGQIVPYIIPLGFVLFLWTKFDSLQKDIRNRTTKDYADTTFQSINMCNERSGQIKDTLDEIKKDVKTLLSKGWG